MTTDLVILLALLLALAAIELGTSPSHPGRRRPNGEQTSDLASDGRPLVALQPVRIDDRDRRIR
jgi:hypothetical protein